MKDLTKYVNYCQTYVLCAGLPFLGHRAGDYRLTGIDDNFAGNYVKIQADFLF